MNEDDSPFYLAVNNNLKAESLQRKEWFKVNPAISPSTSESQQCMGLFSGAVTKAHTKRI